MSDWATGVEYYTWSQPQLDEAAILRWSPSYIERGETMIFLWETQVGSVGHDWRGSRALYAPFSWFITGWHQFYVIISPRLDVYTIYFYFQICQDINECDQQNGGCVTNSKCLNTPVSIVMLVNWKSKHLSISDSTPSKHDTLKQCFFNAGPKSAMLAQH